jgi:Flp pilus assembly protein TadB
VVATVVVALVGAALIAAVARAIWRRRQRPSTSLDQLAEQAQDAIDAIEAGADLKDTVTRCYFEMVQVLREERGIQRQRAMTPREFEARLEEAGIPTAQVRRLTRLFEEVRYGDKSLGDEEERQAVISLTSIVRFCRSAS